MKITRRLVLAGSGAAAAAAKARARSLNVGGGSAFTPPPPPTIVSITISNTSFLQNTGNAVVGSVKVVMSDQSIFNGMISLDTGHGINTEGFHLIGSTLGSNLLAPTGGLPAGSYTDVVIRATQGISTLTIDPTLTAGSLAVTVNGSTSPAAVPSGDSMWIAVRNNPDNNVNTFVAFRLQGTNGGIQRTVFGGVANIDLVIPTTEANQYGQFVGVTPGLYEVILYGYGEGKDSSERATHR